MFSPGTETVMSVAVRNPKACKSGEIAPKTPPTLSPEEILNWFWVSPPLLKGISELRDRKLPCTNRKEHRDLPLVLGVRGLKMMGQNEGVTATGSLRCREERLGLHETHWRNQSGKGGISLSHLFCY